MQAGSTDAFSDQGPIFERLASGKFLLVLIDYKGRLVSLTHPFPEEEFIFMLAFTALSPSSPLDFGILIGAVLAGCVAGASLFLCWLDRQVPCLSCNLSVILLSLVHRVYTILLTWLFAACIAKDRRSGS